MERSRRRRPHGRRSIRAALISVTAALSAIAVVAWLTTAGPLGARNAADGSAGGISASAGTLTGTTSTARATTTATPTLAISTSRAGVTPSPSPSKKASTAKAAASTAAVAVPAGSHLITIVNADDETIWAATNPDARHPIPATGWRLAPGQSVSFTVPAGWGGRIWGRTGCSFDSAGAGHCQTGDCGGLFQCQGAGATPATLAELTLDSFDGLDFYDVSMVDGSNLPMYINTTHRTDADPISSTGCYRGACAKAVACPSAMQVKAGGTAVACETACAAFGGDAYCCTGAWAGRQNCDPTKWPVDYAELVFKDAEPYAYSYAFDDSATMACKGGCHYRITFGITP